MRDQQILIFFGLDNGCFGRFQFVARIAPAFPSGGHSSNICASIAVEQVAVAARVNQPAIIMLAMQLNQGSANLAQQCHPNRLVIDPCLGAAIGL